MRVRIAVYEPDTGAILRVVQCPATAADAQARDGAAWVGVGPDVSDATHRIVDGQAVEK